MNTPRCKACENGGGYHARDCASDTDCGCRQADCRDCMRRPGATEHHDPIPANLR